MNYVTNTASSCQQVAESLLRHFVAMSINSCKAVWDYRLLQGSIRTTLYTYEHRGGCMDPQDPPETPLRWTQDTFMGRCSNNFRYPVWSLWIQSAGTNDHQWPRSEAETEVMNVRVIGHVVTGLECTFLGSSCSLICSGQVVTGIGQVGTSIGQVVTGIGQVVTGIGMW